MCQKAARRSEPDVSMRDAIDPRVARSADLTAPPRHGSGGARLGVPVHTKTYHRVRSGVYVEATAWAALAGWKKYQVRVHAFHLKHPDAVLCLESAAVVLGVPYFGEPRDIHVYDPDRRASRRFGDVCVHTSADSREIGEIGGVSVTSLLDTVVDLVRVLRPAHALGAVDAAISSAQGGTLDLDAVRERADARPTRRGCAQQAWALARADGRAESPGESFSRAVIEWSGYEEPELQREFHYEGFVDRGDFYFASVRGIGESDGWGKYELSDPERAEEHLRQEKRREDRLRRHGHPFARWDYGDAHRVAPLCEALSAAGIPLRHPRQEAKLATLRSNPRAMPRRSRETTSGTRNQNDRGFSR